MVRILKQLNMKFFFYIFYFIFYFLRILSFSFVSNDQRTPLHIASCSGFVKIAELLIKSGANINALDKYQLTPIDLAQTKSMRNLFQQYTE